LVVREKSRRVGDHKGELVIGIVTKAAGKAFRAQLRKIALPLFHGRHGGSRGFALAIAEALVKGKVERFIFANRTADGGAELVLFQ
jgi:hypothetical protein